jgi:nucleoside-diphosphate-sugar epimerase
MDMKDISNCRKVTKNIDYVFNMACNMGGMGFIENNKAECMQSVLINTNLLIACKEDKLKNIFFHQVHVLIIKQNNKKFL